MIFFGDDTLFVSKAPDLEKDALAFQHSAGRDHPYSHLQSVPSTVTNDDKIPSVKQEIMGMYKRYKSR